MKTIGLSATIADPDALRGWLVGQPQPKTAAAPIKHPMAGRISVDGGTGPGARRQRKLLRAEGVQVDERFRVRLRDCGWQR